MSKNKSIADEAFAAPAWLPIALASAGVSSTFKNPKEGLLVLATMLAFVKRAALRELAQEVASDIYHRYPQLDRDECYKEILKRLGKLQEKGQKAVLEFKSRNKKQIKKMVS